MDLEHLFHFCGLNCPVNFLTRLSHPSASNPNTIYSLNLNPNQSAEKNSIPKNVFMVFEYHEYDLTGILETPEIRFTSEHIKSWSFQLLCGVHGGPVMEQATNWKSSSSTRHMSPAVLRVIQLSSRVTQT